MACNFRVLIPAMKAMMMRTENGSSKDLRRFGPQVSFSHRRRESHPVAPAVERPPSACAPERFNDPGDNNADKDDDQHREEVW
jgi:hypothetical protein